ncbi:MAG TPA: hypothetical protein VE085_07410 [Burkholderiales bacterium]|nr:hypothetical protein [Burkholderiales bacterium]
MIRALLALLLTAVLAGPARAQAVTEIWKCKARDGRWTYTNDRNEAEKLKCEVVTRQVNVAPASKAPAGSAGFPKETAAERSSARERQREILEKELTTEQAALAKAQQDLAAQESVRSGGERNYARVEERLQPFKDSIETHQKNIEALKRELSNLYR